MKRVYSLIFLIVLTFVGVSAQEDPVPTLKAELESSKEDTTRLRVLLSLVDNIYDDNVWPGYNDQAFLIAEKLTKSSNAALLQAGKTGMAHATNNRGFLLNNQGKLKESLELYEQSLSLFREIDDKKGIAMLLNNIAQVYDYQGRIREALTYYQQCLDIEKELNDEIGMAGCLNNLGALLFNQQQYSEALSYYEQSRAIQEKIGNKAGLSKSFNNIGLIYKEQKKYDQALDYYAKSLKLKEELGDKGSTGFSLNNIGGILLSMGKTDEALSYFLQSKKVREEAGDNNNLPFSLNNICHVYLIKASGMTPGREKQKLLEEAAGLAVRALELSKANGNIENISKSELYLSRTDSALGNSTGALTHYKNHILFRDSMNNNLTRKAAIRQQMQYEFGVKEAATKVEHEKEIAISESNKKRQNIILIAVLAGLLLTLSFTFLVYRSLKLTSRQKMIIEEKNKDITDSINYAKRIQDALLPQREIKYRLFPDAFVLFRPKDVVSGDFYWFAEKNGKRLIAAVDCTGHGVPGAFMSMIGNTFLNEVVDHQGITSPDLVLNELREMTVKSLKQTGGESKDGMDLALLCFDDAAGTVEFAGANNPLWHFGSGGFSEIKPDKQPIGYAPGNSAPFTRHSMPARKGDVFYIFSDGFADQFGGPKGKKFKYKQLREKLEELHTLPMKEQEDNLTAIFDRWKGPLEQIDDVLVIGIRI